MSLRTVQQNPNSVTIDDSNLILLKSNRPAMEIGTYWHKFIIKDVHGLRRNEVLKILIEHIKPAELIPLYYTEDSSGAYFFARICQDAIETLCEKKLTVPHHPKPFKLRIILKYSSTNTLKIDLSQNLLMVLRKRLKNNFICLSNFCDDPDLDQFFLLSQSRVLAFVLNVAKSLGPRALRLSHNGICSLEALKILPGDSIVSLDVRHNRITDLVELKYLQNLRINELWLEDNPLCDIYDDYNYVQNVLKFCPKIEKLDGFLLRQNGVPSFRRNFLCDMSAHQMVDQFLATFFPSFDTKNSVQLEELYHKNALFSMTAVLSNDTFYKLFTRNLLSSGTEALYTGRAEIIRLFKAWPYLEHDPYSFTVDVLHCNSKFIIFVIAGVFREIPKTERIFGFNRFFVLHFSDGRYRISNEQLHIFDAVSCQQVSAFKKADGLQNPLQKTQLVESMAVITELTKEWAKLFLEECHYNLNHALLLFLDLYKSDRIPLTGFQNLN